ncbi:sigma-70 family RNA polymerase sigma factor [Corallococcus sp. H22C18031201]|uniref:RNA polymerase sigma factor n=1 Tax=Citreicoccus inhibens TaxID=2849499 RepID=UPI000E753675|nr:sigma-70 family RNA polymerase sigma factor [Citreicoccus inhibens]MBU8898330.1 sigma-70 family RNA polymerase sigma factor [Citreicoccus inhibens]RJS15604.1 sigma-70 family RNA polymerase sigma factor [Corallococcus sp. H22C18031201]
MSFPSQPEEQALHERVLARDSLAWEDVFKVFMDPIIAGLSKRPGQSQEDARDATIDVIYEYLNDPERYVPDKARLHIYLAQAARKRTVDRYRSNAARHRREQEYGGVFELRAMPPKDSLEITVEARRMADRLAQQPLTETDHHVIKLVMEGERSTHVLAEAMGLPESEETVRRREVKRNRDRLMKVLGRLRKEDSDV